MPDEPRSAAPLLPGRTRGVVARRKQNRGAAGAVWDHIGKITRHRRRWDTDAPRRVLRAEKGCIRAVTAIYSTCKWEPTSAEDLPEFHGLEITMDIMLTTMSEVADAGAAFSNIGLFANGEARVAEQARRVEVVFQIFEDV